MPIFQKSVTAKYLHTLNEPRVQDALQTYQKYYGDPERLANIELLKEENYQEGFLREIFVQVLGYTINPDPAFTLTTEFKNCTDAKKADGALIKDGKAIAVIELKSTKTKDLESIKQQAFNYKNNQPECKYVITSNYHFLRLYVDNATEYEEFDLFTLTEADFRHFYLLLAQEHLFAGIPEKLKAETKFHEENISDRFYSDYSTFKQKIFDNLVLNNPEYDKLTLFKKSQKLLDRMLFVFFAEDCGLVPPNAISRIVEQWQQLKDLEAYQSLYDRFQLFFGHLNTGHKYQAYELPPYNGGLFAPDDVLAHVKIDDDILAADSLKLSAYDFSTDIDVNILGHIFEHSLSEIEEIAAELEGAPAADKQKSKRKKDGIFYTPKYITQYIVENTIGALCREKKAEIGLDNFALDESHFLKNGRISAKGKTVFDTLTQYKEWLLSLKIVDPACGSGAFLNQALDFLIAEHKTIDTLLNALTNQPLGLFDTDKQILENNLFGVDINEESVEIAKLSLWLRTAQKGRKLSTLNNNIKCGNSLIDDPAVAGDKAFNWQREFPDIFAKGGFDVVIGNPPYVHLEKIKDTSEALEKSGYKTYDRRGDLYTVFVEKGVNLVKKNGLVSYIMPNKWLQAGYGKPLREYFLTQNLIELIDFGDIQIFKGATTYPCIFLLKKAAPQKQFSVSVLKSSNSSDFQFNVSQSAESFNTCEFNGETWVISSQKDNKLLQRLGENFHPLSIAVNGEAFYGIKTGLTEAFLINEAVKTNLVQTDRKSADKIYPFLQGRDISKYCAPQPTSHLLLFEKGETKNSISSEDEAATWLVKNYPSIANWLKPFEEKARKRTDKGDYWWELRACDYYDVFSKPKIMYQKFQVKPCFIYDEQGYYCNDSMWIIPTENKALLGVLNSKMGWWLITKYCTQIQNGCQLIWKYFGQVPIPELSSSELETAVEQMLELTEKQHDIQGGFLKYIQSQYGIEKVSQKLKRWSETEFAVFSREMNTAIKEAGGTKLSKSDELEWMDVFEAKKAEANKLQTVIDRTDNEIDQLVYALYGLTPEEIEIVEQALK